MRENPFRTEAEMPYVLTLPEMARVYRLKESTIRTYLQTGRFRPLPYMKYPYRWRKDDVLRDLARPRVEHEADRQRFGPARLRAAVIAKRA